RSTYSDVSCFRTIDDQGWAAAETTSWIEEAAESLNVVKIENWKVVQKPSLDRNGIAVSSRIDVDDGGLTPHGNNLSTFRERESKHHGQRTALRDANTLTDWLEPADRDLKFIAPGHEAFEAERTIGFRRRLSLRAVIHEANVGCRNRCVLW